MNKQRAPEMTHKDKKMVNEEICDTMEEFRMCWECLMVVPLGYMILSDETVDRCIDCNYD